MHFAGVEIKQAGRHHDFGLRFGERFAFLHRGNGGDLIDALTQQSRRFAEHATAISCTARTPQTIAARGRVQRSIQIVGGGERQLAQGPAGRRIDQPVRRAAGGAQALAVDVELQIGGVLVCHRR